MVVDRAPGDPDRRRDILQRGRGVPAGGEQQRRLLKQRRPGRLGVHLTPALGALHTPSLLTYAAYVTDGGYVTMDQDNAPLFDPFAPGFAEDPYPQYSALRERAPVYHHPMGFWLLTRYEDVAGLLRAGLSVEMGNVSPGSMMAQMREATYGVRLQRTRAPSMLDRDPPDHTRLRRLVSKAFTPRA